MKFHYWKSESWIMAVSLKLSDYSYVLKRPRHLFSQVKISLLFCYCLFPPNQDQTLLKFIHFFFEFSLFATVFFIHFWIFISGKERQRKKLAEIPSVFGDMPDEIMSETLCKTDADEIQFGFEWLVGIWSFHFRFAARSPTRCSTHSVSFCGPETT